MVDDWIALKTVDSMAGLLAVMLAVMLVDSMAEHMDAMMADLLVGKTAY